MAKQIIIVRHGESTGNAGGRSKSAQSIPLSEKGILEAEALVEILPTPDAVIFSPYIRTQQTAAPFLKKHTHIIPEEWQDIHETNFLGEGKHDNTTQEERAVFVKAFWERNDPLFREADTAETFNEFIERGERTIENLKNHPSDTIVVFSHNGFLQLLQFLHQQKSFVEEHRYTPEGLKHIMKTFKERVRTPIPNATPIDFSDILNG